MPDIHAGMPTPEERAAAREAAERRAAGQAPAFAPSPPVLFMSCKFICLTKPSLLPVHVSMNFLSSI